MITGSLPTVSAECISHDFGIYQLSDTIYRRKEICHQSEKRMLSYESVLSKQYVCAQSCLTLRPHGLALLAPLSMEFSRQEYWSGVPFPTPGYIPDPGIKAMSLASPALAGGFFTTSTTWECYQ